MIKYNLTRKPEEIVGAVQHQYFNYNANTNSFNPLSVPIKKGEVIEIPRETSGVFIPMVGLEDRAITYPCMYYDSNFVEFLGDNEFKLPHNMEGVFIPTNELDDLVRG